MDKRIAKTLKNIEESFYRLAKKDGIDNVSVKALCDEAMINKGTFYAHYEGMHQLIDELEEKIINEVIESNRITHESLKNPENVLLNMFEVFARNEDDKIFLHSSRRARFVEKLYTEVRKDFYHSFPELKRIEGFDVNLCFIFNGLMSVSANVLNKNEAEVALTAKNLAKSISAILKQYE